MHKENQLKGMLYSSLRKGVSQGNTRKNDTNIVLHASSILNYCPRYVYIAKKGKIDFEPQGYLSEGTIVTFSIGLAVEDFIVRYLGAYSDNRAYFRFVCRTCGYSDIMISNEEGNVCPNCGNIMQRKQITLEKKIDDKISIKGNPDLILSSKVLGDNPIIIEIKTISSKDFSELKTPFINHLNQVKTYLWLLKNSNLGISVETQYAYIIYVCKEYKRNPIKIFRVPRDKNFEVQMKRFIKEITGKRIPVKICDSEYSLMARNCPAKDICFNWRG